MRARSSIVTYGTTLNTSVDFRRLYQKTRQERLAMIDGFNWHRVKELHILEFPSADQVRMPDNDPPYIGCHVDNTGTWVLLIGASADQIHKVINQCSTALKVLDLRCSRLSHLDVSRLTNLEKLCVSGTEFGSSEEHEFPIRGLSDLPRLTFLDLSFTACTTLPELPKGLRYLNVSGNPELTEVKNLSKMCELEELELSCTDVAHLDLSGQTRLKRLRLVDTPKLTAISGIEKNPDMEFLDLSCSRIRRLPDGISALQKLIHLDLSHLTLDCLPQGMSLPELVNPERDVSISLRGTTIQGFKLGRYDRRRNESPTQEEVQKLIEDFESNAKQPIGEAKVVFLGDGGAGKTRTIARLLTDGGEPEGYTDKTTPGVKISPKCYKINGTNIDVRFWDFGGQPHIFPVHYPFMEDASLYVVMLNAEKSDPNKQARFWLETIGQLKAGVDRPVLLVLNKIDKGDKNGINEPELRGKYQNIRHVIKMSAMKDDRETFQRELIQRLETELGRVQIHAQDVAHHSWHHLRNLISKEQEPKISRDQFERYAEISGVKAGEYENVLTLFGNMGISYTCMGSGVLDQYVILEPNWLTNALYTIAFNRKALEKEFPQTKDGVITHKQIRWILDPDNAGKYEIERVWPETRYTDDEILYILELMRTYKLSVNIDDGVELIPLLCNADTPKEVLLADRSRDMTCYILRYQSLMPDVIHRLILRRHTELQRAWKVGAQFYREEDGAEAIVRIPLRDDDHAENYIQIFSKIQYDQAGGGRYGEELLDELSQIGSELHLDLESRSVIVDVRAVQRSGTADPAPMVKEELDLDEFEYRLFSGDDVIYSKKLKCPAKIMDIRFAAR